MTVLEELQAFEKRVVERLSELRPLMQEYEELQRIADRLGIDIDAAAARPRGRAARRTPTKSAPKPRAPKARSGGAAARRRPGGTRATGAERRERILSLIEQRPGITVPDMSRELGVDPPPLYRVVRKLQADGVVNKEGKGLQLA